MSNLDAAPLKVFEEQQTYDLFFVYHPADVSIVRRIAAQLSAMGSACRFEEDDFSKAAVDIAALKDCVLRSHAVGVVLSPDSAASQLCNELIQHAVNNSKRLVSLILDDEIEVEVHPAIADNPYVYFRERDNLAEQVDELRQYLRFDHETRLHTSLLVAADIWQRRGRRPSQLLPQERVAEARQWLADSSLRTLKPSPLLVEYIHSSRRQRPPSASALPRAKIGLALLVMVALGFGFLLLRAALAANQAGRAAAAQTSTAHARLAITEAAATAASDSALSLVDSLAATSAQLGETVKLTEMAVEEAATQAVIATETAQALATIARATEVYEQARDADAARLVDAAQAALDAGDRELALALAWVAKDALDEPKPAYRVLRRAASTARSLTLDTESMPGFRPDAEQFALIADGGATAKIYDSASWSLAATIDDHNAPITQVAYSPDGGSLVTASSDGEIVVRASDGGDAKLRLSGHAGAVTAIAFHPTGSRLYSAGSDPLLAAWDIESGQRLVTISLAPDVEMTIDKLLATADGERIIGWGAASGEAIMRTWSADSLEISSPADDDTVYRGADAAGQYAYSGGSSLPAYRGDPNTGALIFWDLLSGDEIARLDDGFNWSLGDLSAPSDELQFISFHDGLALAGVASNDGGRRAVVVDLAAGGSIRLLDTDLTANLRSAAFVDRQSLLSVTLDGRLVLWSAADGEVVQEFGNAGREISEFSVNAAANTIIGRTAGALATLWRLDASWGETSRPLSGALAGSGISPGGGTLLLRDEAGFRLAAIDTQEIRLETEAELVGHRDAFIAAYDGARVTLYDFDSGEALRSWTAPWDSLSALHLSADGEGILAVDVDEALWLLSRGRDEPLSLDAISAGAPKKVAYSSDGRRMLSLHEGRAVLWDLAAGHALGLYALDAGSVVAVDAAFDADDDRLVFFTVLDKGLASLTTIATPETVLLRHTVIGVDAGILARGGEALLLKLRDGGIRIIDAAGAETITTLPRATAPPSDWEYLLERGLLIVASGSELIVWDVSDEDVDHVFRHSQPIMNFSASEDGAGIVIRDARGEHHYWRVESPAELLRRIEAENPPRALTCVERIRYLVLPLCE